MLGIKNKLTKFLLQKLGKTNIDPLLSWEKLTLSWEKLTLTPPDPLQIGQYRYPKKVAKKYA
jgi:hypothetical protein